jgi:uncharacterized delta-60 repeat protein
MNRTIRQRRPARQCPRLEPLEARLLLTTAGSLDTTFGSQGYTSVTVNPITSPNEGIPSEGAVATAIQPDGKILLLVSSPSGPSTIEVIRLDANGSLDTTFGTGGIATIAVPTTEIEATPRAMLLEPNGQILVGGTMPQAFMDGIEESYELSQFVARLNANGSLDTSFGTAGTGIVTLGEGAEPDDLTYLDSIVAGPNGTILLAGQSAAPLDSFNVIRLNADGSLDTTFGSNGQTVVGVGMNDMVYGTAVQPNGQIVVVGTAVYKTVSEGTGSGQTSASYTEAVAIRLNADGSLDTSFGGLAASSQSSPGTVVLAPTVTPAGGGIPSAAARSVAIQADGKIVLGGDDGGDVSIIRLDANGVPDSTFGDASGQKLITLEEPIVDSLFFPSIATQIAPGGQIVVLVGGGSDSANLASNLLIQLIPNGSLDPTFGPTIDPGMAPIDDDDEVEFSGSAMALQPDGQIVVAGNSPVLDPSLIGASRSVTTVARFLDPIETAPADYDGSGLTNISVYLAASGEFAYRPTNGGPDVIVPFGIAGAGQTIPAPGDYDGSGQTEIAAYLPSQGIYAYRPADGGPDVLESFGIAGPGQSIPVPGDYFGTGVDDIAVYMPSIGAFGIRNPDGGPDEIIPFGIPGAGNSIPAPGDYFGTGQTDLAVYLPSIGAFAIRNPAGGPDEIIPFGIPGAGNSIPIPGDYDGSGVTELAVYFPKLGEFAYRPANGGPDVIEAFGTPNDGSIPVPGDYTGVGYDEIGIYDPNNAHFAYRPANGGADVFEQFGTLGIGASLPLAAPISSNVALANPTTLSALSTASSTVSSKSVAVTQNSTTVPGGPMAKVAAKALVRIASTLPAQADPSKPKG